MASVTNKEEHDEDLSSEYEKQRLSFIADLRRFNENRGTPFERIPEIGGREIDLYHLYQRVTGLGGRQKVNNEQRWEEFQDEFTLPKACVNSAQALKNIYFRYLNLYEKVNYLGEDPDLKNSEEEEGPARKKICLPIETIPLYYNYNQHKLSDALRLQHSLSTDIYKQSECERLAMSLRSGLPNEVDLAFNVCVLMSTEGKHCLKLDKCPQLLRLLLAHVGIFDEGNDPIQDLYQCWALHAHRNFMRFWFETVDREEIRSLITWKGQQYVQKEMVGSEVLNLGRDLGTLDAEGQRVLQMAVVLHNLSFEEANQKVLAVSYVVYKFLMLSLHSTYAYLRQLALDTFANLSCEFALDSVEGVSSLLVLDLLNSALFSEDRFFLVRGLEILSKMSQLTCNENLLLEHLREDVYKRLVALLTVQDIQLIVHTLEALYKLSKVGEPFTTRIARVHRAIDTLVSLITIEAQSFGPGSLVGIKVVEYVPPTHAGAEDGESVRRPTTVIQPINPDSINIYQVPSNSQSQLSVVADTGGGKGPGGGREMPKAAALEKDKDPATDIQATTSSWLNATYEQKKKSKVNQVELFSDYLQFCRKFGINNALSSAEFLHLVKVIFQQCEVLSINRKNGDKDVYFEGLCKRPSQKPFAVTTLPPEKVRNPLCVNVSHKQTHCQVVDPLAHTPTLRQRLMEPPRVILHPQPPHTGASSSASSSTPNAGPSRNNQTSSKSTPVGPGKVVAGLHARIFKNGKAQPIALKKVVSCSVSSSDSVNVSRATFISQPTLVHKAQTATNNLHSLNSAAAHTFPSITHALQTDQVNRLDAADLLSVKSLLAKKLTQAAPEQDIPSGSGTNSQPGQLPSVPGLSHIMANSTPSSSHIIAQNPSQTASCIVSSSSTILAPSATASILSPLKPATNFAPHELTNTSSQNSVSLVTAGQSNCSLNQISFSPSLIQQVSVGGTMAQQAPTATGAVMAQPHGNISTSIQNSVVSFVQRNANPYMQNAQISLVQQNAVRPHSANISSGPQEQNSLGVHMLHQNPPAASGLSAVPQNSVAILQQSGAGQQSTLTIPCAIMPKVVGAGQQQLSSVVASTAASLCSSTASPQSSTMNHSNRNPSAMIFNNHQGNRMQTVSNAANLPAVSAPVAAANQSISSPAVAALLTTSAQPGSQMIISTPVIAGQVQRPQTISGQAPTTVVIQTPPGTIVMPSRQVVVQGNGSTAFGSIQQGGQGGTVSFIVPSQYRQGQSVTVQGLNFIQQPGTVNMVPSLALAGGAAQSQTQNLMQAAQNQQNLIQAAQNQQNLVRAGAAPRQIVLATNQAKTIPVGVQISSLPGNFVRNLTPQEPQQQNIIIQSSSVQSLAQSMSSSVAVNISQAQPPVASIQIPVHPAESQSATPDRYAPGQQQSQQQILNISSTVVLDSQSQQSSQCNGLNHDINGILGSPELMGNDFPPSPLSLGSASDKDMPNGKFSDVDKDPLVKKSDIARVMEKAKLNGYIHSLENSSRDVFKSLQTESQNSRSLAHTLHPESQGVVINGCVPNVIHSVGHRMNIPGLQGDGSSGGSNGAVIQIQAPPVQQQVVISSGQVQQKVVGFVQQQQVQFQQQVAQQLDVQQQQVQILAQPHQVFQQQIQVPRQQLVGASIGHQQLRPRISTLPCQPPGPQAGAPTIRPALCRDMSKDSDASSDSLASITDVEKPQLTNGQSSQTLIIVTPTSKNKPKSKKLVVSSALDKFPPASRSKKREDGGATGQKPIHIIMEYMCEWANCKRCFSTARLVFIHVFKQHLPKTAESSCQWVSCEKLVRKRWSLVSHIQDHHCSESAMRAACQRRFLSAQQQSGGSVSGPAPHQPMIYPPDAAMQAIRRFSIKQPYAEFADQREGPVSKHIRLTAALILRNICHFSSLGRRLIKRHEQELCHNTMNAVEASTALSHCLWEIVQSCEMSSPPKV